MPETVQHCPLCQGPHSRIFDRRAFRGQTVVNRLCENCGLVYQSPRMSAAELEAFYRAQYRELYQGDAGPTEKELATQKQRAVALLGFVDGVLKDPRRHLDIGCSTGLLLTDFAARFGCQPVGIEPGDAYRQHAQASGLTVYPALDELRRQEHERFDLVSMIHTLEHLPDPLSYLESLRGDILAPEGALLIEVPNLYAHDSFEVAHTVSFSAHTLGQLLRQAGFEIIKLEKHGRPRSLVLPLYLTALARPLAQPIETPIRPERRVALNRKLGFLRRRLLQRLMPRRAWLPKGGIDD